MWSALLGFLHTEELDKLEAGARVVVIVLNDVPIRPWEIFAMWTHSGVLSGKRHP